MHNVQNISGSKVYARQRLNSGINNNYVESQESNYEFITETDRMDGRYLRAQLFWRFRD